MTALPAPPPPVLSWYLCSSTLPGLGGHVISMRQGWDNGNGRQWSGLSITLDAFGKGKGQIIYHNKGEMAGKEVLSAIFVTWDSVKSSHTWVLCYRLGMRLMLPDFCDNLSQMGNSSTRDNHAPGGVGTRTTTVWTDGQKKVLGGEKVATFMS